MIELLLFGITPTPNPLLPIEPPPITIQVEAEPTLAEQIATDINNCEPERFISAEDASCIEKPVNTPLPPQSTLKTAVRGSNAPSGWYPHGQCTYWVWSNRAVGSWNDATDWLWQAKRDGWSTGSTPVVGAIAWEYGHVSLVEAVNGDMVTISEMNYQGLGIISRRTLPASQFTFIY